MTRTHSALTIYKSCEEDQLSFSYRGPFHESLTERIVDISENTVADQLGLKKINRKVSFLLVECFQNIIKHGEKIKEDQSELFDEGMFSFKNHGDSYVINSINIVRDDEVEALKNTVDLVNSKSKQELKELYKQQLVDNEMSDKGGAGLGLIEIARKSGNKLLYEFERLSNGYHQFHQQVYFSKEAAEIENKILETKNLYKNLETGHLLLTYKGDFSQKSILPLLSIVESNIGRTKKEISMAKKVGHVLIEMLQNISRHALEVGGSRDGVFLIGKQEGHFFVQTGNLISEEHKIDLTSRLGSIQSMHEDELIDLHRARILESINLVDKSKSGLGLIQIAKASYSPISYNFQPLNDAMFFTLKVVV